MLFRGYCYKWPSRKYPDTCWWQLPISRITGILGDLLRTSTPMRKKLLQLTRIRTNSYQNTGTRLSRWEVAVAWLPATELQHSHQLRSQPTPRADWLWEPAYRQQRHKTIGQRQVIWHWSFRSHAAQPPILQWLTHNSFSLPWVEMRRKGQVVLLVFLRIAIL